MAKAAAGLLALAAILCSNTAFARERVELAPSTNWVVDYDDDSCVLLRRFGEPGRSAQLEIRQFSPHDYFQVIITSADFEWHHDNILMSFQPDEQGPMLREVTEISLSDGSRGFLRQFTMIPWADRERLLAAPSGEPQQQWSPVEREERERAITGIQLERGFSSDLFLATGSMRAPMNAMRACMDELMGHWGIDVAAHRNLQRPARPSNFNELARQLVQRYPSQMARRGQQAVIQVRLNVSAEGLPTGCHHQIDYNDEQFETISCRILMREARFTPALDASGTAIDSYYNLSVYYSM